MCTPGVSPEGWGGRALYSLAVVSSRISFANLKRGTCLETGGSAIASTISTGSPGPDSSCAQQAQGTTLPLPHSCLPGCSHLPALLVFFSGFPRCSCLIPCHVIFSYGAKTPAKLAGHPCSPFQPRMVPITSPGHSASRPCREIPPPALGVLLPALAAWRAPHEHLLALTPAVLGSQRFGSAQLQGAQVVLCWDVCVCLGHVLSFSGLFCQGRDPAWRQCGVEHLVGCSPLRNLNWEHPIPRDNLAVQSTRQHA